MRFPMLTPTVSCYAGYAGPVAGIFWLPHYARMLFRNLPVCNSTHTDADEDTTYSKPDN